MIGRQTETDAADKVADRVVGRAGMGRAPTRALVVLILVQMVCVAFFLSDVAVDIGGLFGNGLRDWHTGVETVAALALLVSVAVQVRVLLHLLTRQRRLARAVTAAAGGLHDLVEGYFEDWALTASERDVAWLTLKGLSLAEVAAIRGSAEGTVKAHLHAVYRKSGLQGRAALMSLVIEDLMSGEVPVGPEEGTDAGARSPAETTRRAPVTQD